MLLRVRSRLAHRWGLTPLPRGAVPWVTTETSAQASGLTTESSSHRSAHGAESFGRLVTTAQLAEGNTFDQEHKIRLHRPQAGGCYWPLRSRGPKGSFWGVDAQSVTPGPRDPPVKGPTLAGRPAWASAPQSVVISCLTWEMLPRAGHPAERGDGVLSEDDGTEVKLLLPHRVAFGHSGQGPGSWGTRF